MDINSLLNFGATFDGFAKATDNRSLIADVIATLSPSPKGRSRSFTLSNMIVASTKLIGDDAINDTTWAT